MMRKNLIGEKNKEKRNKQKAYETTLIRDKGGKYKIVRIYLPLEKSANLSHWHQPSATTKYNTKKIYRHRLGHFLGGGYKLQVNTTRDQVACR